MLVIKNGGKEGNIVKRIYRDEPMLQLPFRVLTRLMDIDAQLTNWRSNHALMAQ